MDECFRILEFLEPKDETGTKLTALASSLSWFAGVSGVLARESRASRASALLLLLP